MTSLQKSTPKILAVSLFTLLIFAALVGWASIPALFPVPPVIPTAHVPQVSNGLLAFTAKQAGSSDIHTMNPDGTDIKRLTENPGDDSYPMWTLDGKQIFYWSDAPGDCVNVMNADGTDKHCLPQLKDPSRSDSRLGIYIDSLVWSPDGTKLAFGNGTPFIFTMNPDGSEIRRIPSDGSTDLVSAWPAWSPDGTQIALGESALIDDEHGGIYIVDADGNNLVQLSESDSGNKYPHWTPDGTHIIFQSTHEAGTESETRLYVMDLQGENERRLLSLEESTDEMFWGVSPDGKKLMISAWMKAEKRYALLILDASDYSVAHVLLATPSVDEEIYWSPDSKQILYMDNNQLYHIVNVDGTQDRELVTPFDNARSFVWQPVWK